MLKFRGLIEEANGSQRTANSIQHTASAKIFCNRSVPSSFERSEAIWYSDAIDIPRPDCFGPQNQERAS